jgi:hypothetical protein
MFSYEVLKFIFESSLKIKKKNINIKLFKISMVFFIFLFFIYILHFQELGSVQFNSDSFSDNVRGEAEIVQKGIVDVSEGSWSGSLLGFVLLDPFGDNGSFGGD